MPRQCDICCKGTSFGRSHSHAHNVTNRKFEPNLRRVRAFFEGTSRRIWVCTRCLRSGFVQKPPVRNWTPEATPPKATPPSATR